MCDSQRHFNYFSDFIQFFNYFLNQLNELKFNKIVEINLTKFKQTNKSQPPTSALETTWLKSRRALSTFSRVYRMFVDVRRERNVPHGTRSTPAPDTEEPGGTRTCRLCFHFNFSFKLRRWVLFTRWNGRLLEWRNSFWDKNYFKNREKFEKIRKI